jgi:hypothetical protein
MPRDGAITFRDIAGKLTMLRQLLVCSFSF